MDNINKKLQMLAQKIENRQIIRIAILGLGSVGNYLLNYLNSWEFNNIEIYIGSRSTDKA